MSHAVCGRCNVPNCFFASNYFFALPMTEIIGLVFPTVGKMLKALNVKDEARAHHTYII